MQAPPLPLDSVEFLREHEKDAMKLLRKMPKLLTLKAAKRAKELKKKKEEEKNGIERTTLEEYVGGE